MTWRRYAAGVAISAGVFVTGIMWLQRPSHYIAGEDIAAVIADAAERRAAVEGLRGFVDYQPQVWTNYIKHIGFPWRVGTAARLNDIRVAVDQTRLALTLDYLFDTVSFVAECPAVDPFLGYVFSDPPSWRTVTNSFFDVRAAINPPDAIAPTIYGLAERWGAADGLWAYDGPITRRLYWAVIDPYGTAAISPPPVNAEMMAHGCWWTSRMYDVYGVRSPGYTMPSYERVVTNRPDGRVGVWSDDDWDIRDYAVAESRYLLSSTLTDLSYLLDGLHTTISLSAGWSATGTVTYAVIDDPYFWSPPGERDVDELIAQAADELRGAMPGAPVFEGTSGSGNVLANFTVLGEVHYDRSTNAWIRKWGGYQVTYTNMIVTAVPPAAYASNMISRLRVFGAFYVTPFLGVAGFGRSTDSGSVTLVSSAPAAAMACRLGYSGLDVCAIADLPAFPAGVFAPEYFAKWLPGTSGPLITNIVLTSLVDVSNPTSPPVFHLVPDPTALLDGYEELVYGYTGTHYDGKPCAYREASASLRLAGTVVIVDWNFSDYRKGGKSEEYTPPWATNAPAYTP